ncbi:MAG: thioredoxin family protein [Burkholderiales bacterium]|jgi:thioredoxin 1|uniref:thioredoxin family protein n=1 Tax=Limnohabitans sp. TaxID=1907725 RepID=UPI0037C05E18
MVTNKPYLSDIELPSRADLDALRGLTLLEFGTDWCGHCRAAKPFLEEALAQHPQWQYLKIEDGPGKALGRSYRVKLWPTLVLLQDGQEVGRLVRPTNVQELLVALSV